MQKICSFNELRTTFMFRAFFIPAPAHSCDWQDKFYIHKAPINSALFSCIPLCYQSDLDLHTAYKCPSARLWKHDLSMKETLHIQVGKGQPAALLHVRINGMPKAL